MKNNYVLTSFLILFLIGIQVGFSQQNMKKKLLFDLTRDYTNYLMLSDNFDQEFSFVLTNKVELEHMNNKLKEELKKNKEMFTRIKKAQINEFLLAIEETYPFWNQLGLAYGSKDTYREGLKSLEDLVTRSFNRIMAGYVNDNNSFDILINLAQLDDLSKRNIVDKDWKAKIYIDQMLKCLEILSNNYSAKEISEYSKFLKSIESTRSLNPEEKFEKINEEYKKYQDLVYEKAFEIIQY